LTLIKSISGIRGTIGGKAGDGLTPIDIVKYTGAFVSIMQRKFAAHNTSANSKRIKVVVGRDARLSGEAVMGLVNATLISCGADVINLDLSTTPTVEMAVTAYEAQAGIIITASHNPKQWNALKLLNEKGEFISEAEGKEVLSLGESGLLEYADVNDLGVITNDHSISGVSFLNTHIEKILALPYVDKDLIASKNFKIALDAVNSSGGIAVPMLLEALGVKQIAKLNCEPTGHFAHNPEPLAENLMDLSRLVKHEQADLGIAVDPDVDRLAFVCEDGEMFGEEYTLVAVADHVLSYKKGNTVSNLSSTRALRDVTEKAGSEYFASAVGEVNVVSMMKEKKAVIGGEGNGGIILPELHYGRDALVGIAMFLTHLAKFGKSISALRSTYPDYYMSKNKIELTPEIDVDAILVKIQTRYPKQPINTIDGVKIEFDNSWVHLRKSNTEPIIRIYSEAPTMTIADHIANNIIEDIKAIIKEK
jgi:phosphomannomutase